MNIICKLDLINRVIGIDLLSETLLPAIFELTQDKVSLICICFVLLSSISIPSIVVLARQGVHYRAYAVVRRAARPLFLSRTLIGSLCFLVDGFGFRSA